LQKLFIPLVSIFLFIRACIQNSSENSITIPALKEKFYSDSSIIILDVRTSEELNGTPGKLDEVINIPVQGLERRLPELEKYKGREIALNCTTGRRSANATDNLIQNGFDGKNILGGMVEHKSTE